MLSETLRHKLRSGVPVSGCTISGYSPEQVEMLGLIGYDFAFLDSEHWPLSDRELMVMITSGDAVGMACLVRVRENTPAAIQRVMDSGAAGVIVPDIASAELARRVIDAVKYQPEGKRGLSTTRASGYGLRMGLGDYIRYANEKSVVVCQCESQEGVDHVDEVIENGLIDTIFIGTTDLSNSMGFTGQRNNSEVNAAVSSVLQKCRAAGKCVGAIVRPGESPRRYIDEGYGMMVAGGSGFFTAGAKSFLNEFQ